MSSNNLGNIIPFAEFVANKPKDEEIDHSYWRTCAVGEWVKANKVHYNDEHTAYLEAKVETLNYLLPAEALADFEEFGDFYRERYDDKPSLYDTLNIADSIIDSHQTRELNFPFVTYGQLTELINACTYDGAPQRPKTYTTSSSYPLGVFYI